MAKEASVDLVYLPQSDTEGKRLLELRGFKDCGGLKYSLRSVEKFAPWINQIYIVSNGKVPDWLDVSNPKIKIVDHFDKIESLSEKFLIADEDMYFGAPVKKSDFFTKEGCIIQRCHRTPNFSESHNIKARSKNFSNEKIKIKYTDSLDEQKKRYERSVLNPLRYYKKGDCLILQPGFDVTNQNPKICLEIKPKLLSVHPTIDVHPRQAELVIETLKKMFPSPSCFEKDKLIHICFSTNDEYTKHCAAAIVSIIENCKDKSRLRFHVLHNEMSIENQKKLEKTVKNYDCDIEIHKINFEDFKDCQVAKNSHFTVETYFRLKIPDLINYADKIIYIDCDTTIMGNIEELWDTELDNNYLAACQDVTQPQHLKKEMGDDIYFNAGVLVINAKLWRIENLSKKLFDFMAEYPHKIIWVDQDALNGVLHSRIKIIPSNWNVMYNPCYDKLSNLYDISEIKLIHHVSKDKPWNTSSKHKYAKQYFKYLAKTEWKNMAYSIPLKLMSKKLFSFIYNYRKNRKLVAEFEKSIKNKKVVLWGASLFINKIIRFYGLNSNNILGIIDRDINKQGKKMGKYSIYNPKNLKLLNPDLVVCSVINHPRMGEYINEEINSQELKIDVWENCFERLKDRI